MIDLTNPEKAGFAAFNLARPIADALAKAKFSTPTPIQAQAIPVLLDGNDIIGIAQTGTGKTAAFALPMLQLHVDEPRRPAQRTARMIVLSPTRELAVQIAETFRSLAVNLRLSLATMFGGVSDRGQIAAAEKGIDILVATPGRLLDLVERRYLRLNETEVFVLDEADRMLDMGFVREVKKLVRLLPKDRQSLMFSATMPPAIREIAAEMLHQPVSISVTPEVVTVEKIEQSVYHIAAKQKGPLLRALLDKPELSRVVVFCRTKHGANKVADHLERANVSVAAIHGNKSQNARQAALNAFKSGNARVLVATDIASRGIDVPGISHVVNYELPNEPEAYVHRIGRTARAGRDGEAISFCDPSERSFLKQIERLTRVPLAVKTFDGALPADLPPAKREPRRDEPRRDEPRRDEPRRAHRQGSRPFARDDVRQESRQEPRKETRQESRPDNRPDNRNDHRGNPQQQRPHAAKPAAAHQPEGDNAQSRRNRPGSRARARLRNAA
jgi:ATP-dependent RNA helicase RhlE